MSSGAALQEDYCRCLERDFRRGRAGVCADTSLQERLRQRLLEDPELHGVLYGEDFFAVLATALRGQLDLGGALRNLGKAFEVLELAAINLYFFPWRKEFGTIKTFSGVYVHVLQGVLPEADLARCFHRLGYLQKDKLHLVISQLPPSTSLIAAACGFFAARVECEILGKIVKGLEPYVASPGELLQARKEARGSLDGCVAKLQGLVRWPRSRELQLDPAEGIDLYRESPEGQSPYDEPLGTRLQTQHPLSFSEHGSSRLWSREPHLPSPQGLAASRSQTWTAERPYDNGILGPETPDLETSFSFISLRREQSRTSEADCSSLPGSWFLSPSLHHDSPQAQRASSPTALSPRLLRSPQLSPVSIRGAPGAGGPVGEPPRYYSHSCMRPGALPASCCNTCRLLHDGSCSEAGLCRSSGHRVEELQSEKQQRLWLQRTEVDKLLYEGAGAWQ